MGDEGVDFGRRLRELRLRSGLSQAELERRSGIPKARLSRYENGWIQPSVRTIGRLATALGVSQTSLIHGDDQVADVIVHTLLARGVLLNSRVLAAELAVAIADVLDALGGN